MWFVIAEMVSLGFAVKLWREQASLLRRLVWTPVVFFKVLGPVFYLGLFDVPPPSPEHLQLKRRTLRSPPTLGGC